MIDNKQATKRIYNLMCEIRDTIRNLDPELEDLYLSLTIQSDGAITFNNTYWDLPDDLQINYHEECR